MVNQKLLETCKAALECIAKLTPFPNPDAPEEIQYAMCQVAEYADGMRAKLRDAITEAEKQKIYNWIPVEEGLPPDTRWVWAYGPVQPEPTIAAYHADEKSRPGMYNPLENPGIGLRKAFLTGYLSRRQFRRKTRAVDILKYSIFVL